MGCKKCEQKSIELSDIKEQHGKWKQQIAEQYADTWDTLDEKTKNEIRNEDLKFELQEMKLNKEVAELKRKEQQFYEARRQAFADLEERHKQEKKELQDLWQEKENNGFDINYIPE